MPSTVAFAFARRSAKISVMEFVPDRARSAKAPRLIELCRLPISNPTRSALATKSTVNAASRSGRIVDGLKTGALPWVTANVASSVATEAASPLPRVSWIKSTGESRTNVSVSPFTPMTRPWTEPAPNVMLASSGVAAFATSEKIAPAPVIVIS